MRPDTYPSDLIHPEDVDAGGLLTRRLWRRWSRPNETRGKTAEERSYYALSEGVYARFARAYDLAVSPILGNMRRDVVQLSGARTDSQVVDVATGTGEQARAFATNCKQVVGVDLSDAMLRVARAKSPLPGLTYVQADATSLPFDDGSFDVASISFALHEMPATIRAATLAEMLRVTKPGGIVVVVDWGLPQGFLARRAVYRAVRFFEDTHYSEFIRLDLESVLARHGITVAAEHRALWGAARIIVGTKGSAL
jgi:ubiquinone/menaquinone biosynthesis C-methylase UbiE